MFIANACSILSILFLLIIKSLNNFENNCSDNSNQESDHCNIEGYSVTKFSSAHLVDFFVSKVQVLSHIFGLVKLVIDDVSLVPQVFVCVFENTVCVYSHSFYVIQLSILPMQIINIIQVLISCIFVHLVITTSCIVIPNIV